MILVIKFISAVKKYLDVTNLISDTNFLRKYI